MQPVSPLGWQTATITRIVRRTARARSFFLRASSPFAYRAGQHVDVRLTAPDGYQARRGYSIASAPSAGEEIELCIKQLEGGEVSPFFHDVAAPGDEIELRGPLGGHFVWSSDESGPVLLVGGGSGVVPLVAMVRERAARRVSVPMALVFSARTAEAAMFRDELIDLHHRRDGFELILTLTQDPDPPEGAHRRRVDAAMIGEAIAALGTMPEQAFLCGANAFVDAAAQAAAEAGVRPERIKTERYGG